MLFLMKWEAIWSPPWSPKSLFWSTYHLVTVDGWNPAPDKLSMLATFHEILFGIITFSQHDVPVSSDCTWARKGRHLGCWSFGLPFADGRFLEAQRKNKNDEFPGKSLDPPFLPCKIRGTWQWFIDTQKKIPHFTVIFSKPFIDRCYVYPYQLSIVEGFIVSSIIARESVRLAWFCQQKWVICVMKEWMVQSGMPSKSPGAFNPEFAGQTSNDPCFEGICDSEMDPPK